MYTGRSSSPRRSLSDSMDCDDEELQEYSNRELGDSDEDTEDASEDGDESRHEDAAGIKEQVYFEKLAQLKSQLQQLVEGSHPEYRRKIGKIEREYNERLNLNDAWRDYEKECVEIEYKNEKKRAAREFEEKKIELRESLISELEEKKKGIEHERFNVELSVDAAEVKPTTRKLRRRPNDPVPLPEKRRKTPQSQITFLLQDKDIDDDLLNIMKAAVTGPPAPKSLSSISMEDLSPSGSLQTDTRIEDGKLFYEKRWYHRGQHVYVEGKEMSRISGVISSISHDTIWIKKFGDQNKFRLLLSHLAKGKCSIKRRA